MAGTPLLRQEEALDSEGEHPATEAEPEQAAQIRESDPCYRQPEGA